MQALTKSPQQHHEAAALIAQQKNGAVQLI